MARSFNGSTDQIVSGSTTIPASLTYSAWVYPTSLTPAKSGIVCRNDGAAHPAQVLINSSGTIGWYFGGQAIDPGSHTLSTNTWTHLAATWDSTNGLATYVNGASDGTAVLNGTVASTTTTGIGFDTVTPSRNFGGRIADVGIWSVALTGAEIGALAQGFLPTLVRPNSLFAFYPLDGLQSPEPDLSGNANNGTLTGTTAAAGPPVTLFTPRWQGFALPTPPPALPMMGQIWI